MEAGGKSKKKEKVPKHLRGVLKPLEEGQYRLKPKPKSAKAVSAVTDDDNDEDGEDEDEDEDEWEEGAAPEKLAAFRKSNEIEVVDIPIPEGTAVDDVVRHEYRDGKFVEIYCPPQSRLRHRLFGSGKVPKQVSQLKVRQASRQPSSEWRQAGESVRQLVEQ